MQLGSGQYIHTEYIHTYDNKIPKDSGGVFHYAPDPIEGNFCQLVSKMLIQLLSEHYKCNAQ